MQLGMVGLGRMGGNMARRLLQAGHEVAVSDRSSEAVQAMAAAGAQGTSSLAELTERLTPPRAVWVMVPSGAPTEETIRALREVLAAGDIIIDGGNTYYKDDLRRAEELRGAELHYVDVGTSGGIWGLEAGYCLMVGGERRIVAHLEPIFHALAPENGYLYTGPCGSGHFTKMIHNGIEYAMMQAYGEGFELLRQAPFDLDLHAIAAVWNHGSVVRSWLLELLEAAFKRDPDLGELSGYVEDSGEGRWTILQAIEEEVPAPGLALALFTRFRSRQDRSFAERVLAALRREFGGHAVRRAAPPS
ncbi:MAG: decarboxylating 6-phosphogluconate dehydrogenase [Candidatus Tectomicrobia bacterium]|nr:decarboxylating 6-phosphogluconate dehydrogenase [Candidatus Tectomicrobia bacterium]